jgi:hypothetical protein
MILRWSQMHKNLQISVANLQTMCNEVLKSCENVLVT